MTTRVDPKPGDWVLLKGDSVVACGRDVGRLIKLADSLESEDLVISKEPISPYCYYGHFALQKVVGTTRSIYTPRSINKHRCNPI